MDLDGISWALGWGAAAMFAVGCGSTCHKVLTPPSARPAGGVVAVMLLADATNLVGSVLAQAPDWQYIVAAIFLLSDIVLLYAICTLLTPVTEQVTKQLRGALLFGVALTFLIAVNAVLREAETREIAIEMGIVSAICNIALRVWKHPSNAPPTLGHWLGIIGQIGYSSAILTHPDGARGTSYLEESIPWLAGSIIPALIEFNVASTFRQKHKRDTLLP